ncbi:MAG: PIG-L family deacetylase [Bdellovibrionaceae bacterium]|nr:PIG-L family deacetylase [Pseudobdellovibrionaceae bacterium]
MAKAKYNLLVVSHPDDETIFFGGLLLKQRRLPWHVVCVTDGNADGDGVRRKQQFTRACRAFKVKSTAWLGLPDRFEQRLDVASIASQLRQISAPQSVFTHGVLGEYGHPHHQDVSFAVHTAFAGTRVPVYSVAHNCFPDLIVRLQPKDYATKTKVLSQIYFSETRRFATFLPATAVEGFARVSPREVEAIYRFFVEKKPLSPKDLKTYRWFLPYLEQQPDPTAHRPF